MLIMSNTKYDKFGGVIDQFAKISHTFLALWWH
jgi:hypothetical protein